jgi:uncharacterized membrane protein YccF (DUF307 family)
VKFVGMLLLLFGGVIAIIAIALLRHPVEQGSFVVAGLALECLGLTLVARDYAQTKRNVG